MGLQGHVSDCSTETFFVLTVAIVGSFVRYLRSFTFMALRYLNLSRFDPDADEGMFGFTYGFTGLVTLAEQLNLNRVLSHAYGGDGDGDESAPSQCVVCLSKLKEGEQVRKLPCRHVFHKGCFDGWLDQLNFSCPICRSPLASPERVEKVERRVGHELLAFFSLR